MRQVADYEEIRGRTGFSKGKISNCYWMPEEFVEAIQNRRLYEEDAAGGSAWILRTEGRDQFFYQTDRENAGTFVCRLPDDSDYVAEIIHRGTPSAQLDAERDILSGCGFRFHDLARMMTCKPPFTPYAQAEGRSVRRAIQQDCDTVFLLMQDSFDRLTDAIPARHELMKCIDRGEIWVIEDLSSGRILGCTLFESAGRRTWIRHVTVDKAMRGKGIAKELIRAYIAQGDPNGEYALWVKDGNKAAVALYDRLGFETTNRQMDIWTRTMK